MDRPAPERPFNKALAQFSLASAAIQPPAQAPIEALYLHSPFCFHKCHYCDFYSIVADDPQRMEAFVRRLQEELRGAARRWNLRLRTVFFGGGTPTLLPPPLLTGVLGTLRDLGVTDRLVEFTVEANPETVSPATAQALVAGGVDRVSLGAQSFDPALLKTLERWHDPASVGQAVRRLREAGIGRINLDLIFAIPGQTESALQSDLDQALRLEPDHLSCYSLTFEPGTALSQRQKLGQIQPVEEEQQRRMYERVMQRLEAAGFEHYEISNWARPGQRCEHNLVYWHNGNWLGCGPSAASHVEGWRWRVSPHLGRYLGSWEQWGGPPAEDVEHLGEAARAGERLMLGLRLREGVPHADVQQWLEPNDPRWGVMDHLRAIGMLEDQCGRLRISAQGLFVADAVLGQLL